DKNGQERHGQRSQTHEPAAARQTHRFHPGSTYDPQKNGTNSRQYHPAEKPKMYAGPSSLKAIFLKRNPLKFHHKPTGANGIALPAQLTPGPRWQPIGHSAQTA